MPINRVNSLPAVADGLFNCFLFQSTALWCSSRALVTTFTACSLSITVASRFLSFKLACAVKLCAADPFHGRLVSLLCLLLQSRFTLAARTYRFPIAVALCLCSDTLPNLLSRPTQPREQCHFRETNLHLRSTGLIRQVALPDLTSILAQDPHATAGDHFRDFQLPSGHLGLTILAVHPDVLLHVDRLLSHDQLSQMAYFAIPFFSRPLFSTNFRARPWACSFRQPVLRFSALFRHSSRTCLCGQTVCESCRFS